MRKKALFVFLLLGAITMVIMSFHYFLSNTAGILRKKEIANSIWYLLTFRTHIFLGLIAIVIGPFQFVSKLRLKHKNVHKAIGYIYVVSVVFSSLAGLLIAQFAMGGWITSTGFSVLSMAWLFTCLRAINAVRKGNISRHKMWMYFSYSLTFSAIIQRTLLLIPLFTDIPFIPIYQLSAWLPWIFNLSIAYYLFDLKPVQNKML